MKLTVDIPEPMFEGLEKMGHEIAMTPVEIIRYAISDTLMTHDKEMNNPYTVWVNYLKEDYDQQRERTSG